MVTKLTLEYDGRPFYGWAAQPGRPTVEAELQRALETSMRQPVKLTVAGRTDRGVHALGQVVSYEGPLPYLRSVNALLPNEIAVVSAEAAAAEFSARWDAKSRSYTYRLYRRSMISPFDIGRALWWPYPLNYELLERCADLLVGKHDFRAFTPSESHHKHFERTVFSAGWERRGGASDLLEFQITADTFLRHMNRILIGTMPEVAAGDRTVEEFGELLTGKPRSVSGRTAPAHGLYLVSVGY
jgi:tRNA pseudouridine38-40 synthase